MDKSQAITLLEELKDFLRDIGCGEIYGILGHDAGGILGNSILYNGGCHELDRNGNLLPCRLCPRDKQDIETVQDDMYEVIERGRKTGSWRRLTSLFGKSENEAIYQVHNPMLQRGEFHRKDAGLHSVIDFH